MCYYGFSLFCFSDQAEARRARGKEARKRREERIAAKKAEALKITKDDDTQQK